MALASPVGGLGRGGGGGAGGLITVCAIDVGTNSVLLVIARAARGGGVEVLRDQAHITRIGKGVDRTGELAPASVQATLDVLRDYVAQARELGAEVIAAVGTSALRDATNARAFLDPAAEILGSPIEVITGSREARLTFLGATQGLELGATESTVIDIGGGSTEIVRGAGTKVREAASVDIGSVRLFERHVSHDPPTAAELEAAERSALRALGSAPLTFAPPVVGIAGTVTTLSAMAQELETYDPDRVHGSRIELPTLDALIERMTACTTEARSRMPGLDPRRADVIVVGALILRAALRTAGARTAIVSNGGVRMGLATELLDKRAGGLQYHHNRDSG